MEKRRILVIMTGGTIGSAISPEGASVESTRVDRLEERLKEFYNRDDCDFVVKRPFGPTGLDSSNIAPWRWLDILQVIRNESRVSSGVLILYGTDTMAYASAFLSIALPSPHVPVILTGSQLTFDYTSYDVEVNMYGAAKLAEDGPSGVWLYFNWVYHRGDRVTKARAQHPDAFRSVNAHAIPYRPDYIVTRPQTRRLEVSEKLRTVIDNVDEKEARRRCSGIRTLFLTPGSEPLLKGDEKILIIVGFGCGNMPEEASGYIESIYHDNKPIIIAASQSVGDKKTPSAYKGVGIAGLAEKGFKVFGQSDYPIEFLYSLSVWAMLSNPEYPGHVLGENLPVY